MYLDAKKLIKQKNYIMKPSKITEMEIEEIKREMQTSQRSHPAEREEETLIHTDTIKDDEQTERSNHNKRKNGNSTTQGSYYQIKGKKLKARIIR
jgi:hypothetical protein